MKIVLEKFLTIYLSFFISTSLSFGSDDTYDDDHERFYYCRDISRNRDIDMAAGDEICNFRIRGYYYTGYTDVSDIKSIPISSGQKVLDVGAGDGTFTKFLQSKAGAENVYALEPDVNCLNQLSEKIGKQFVKNWSLKEALMLAPTDYFQKFDVATVLKYNIPSSNKVEFLTDLSHTIHINGVVYITCVEYDIAEFRGNEYPYIIGTLNSLFGEVYIDRHKNQYGSIQYALITCKKPKNKMV